ncbi:MAG TPA: hypothetical protein VFI53_19830 [Myxococcaceae bacterium]|nr:hypothetical protein [Myxococcaceae bacterium]
MSLTRSLAMLLFLGAAPSARAEEAKDPLAVAAPLVGRWEADPDPKSPGATGWTVFERAAQGRALLRKNHAQYPATKERPASTHDDVMLLFSENGQLRAEYVDNEGHVIRYQVQSPSASTLVFLSEAGAPGPRFRLTYSWPSKDRLDLTFEIAPPGPASEFKPYIQARLHRTAPG